MKLNQTLTREALLYLLFGLLAVSLDTSIFFYLRNYTQLTIPIANLISIGVGATLSYLLNFKFNFKSETKYLQRMMVFYIIAFLGYVASTQLILLGLQVGIPELSIKLIAIVIVSTGQFILNKFITFKTI